MRSIALSVFASSIMMVSACSGDQPAKDSGSEQLPAPAVNSGPETEAARANNAVRDSSDTTPKKDTIPSASTQAPRP